MIRPVPQIALDFLFKAEACVLTPYKDSGGIPTVGVGHTGPDVKMGAPISPAQAADYLKADADTAAYRLAGCVHAPVINVLDEHEYAALISFVFNVGANAKWTIWKDLNALQFDAVPAQLMRFDKITVDGVAQTLPGLEHRRTAEVALWRMPDAVAAATIAQAVPAPPSSTTRMSETPPTPLPPKAMSKTSLATKVVSMVAAAGALATKISAVVQPHVDQVPAFANLAMVLTCVVVATGVISLLISQHQTAVAAT